MNQNPCGGCQEQARATRIMEPKTLLHNSKVQEASYKGKRMYQIHSVLFRRCCDPVTDRKNLTDHWAMSSAYPRACTRKGTEPERS